MLYLIASPVAIMANKILMKDKGFGYPVMVSAMGQVATALCAAVVVFITGESLETGRKIGATTLLVLGCVSALALVLGQYPYFYLTVAFIQMLKAFSPAYMICFLFCLGAEPPVNFSLIGVLFMTMASCSDALRLVIAQKLLKNQKMGSFEASSSSPPPLLLLSSSSPPPLLLLSSTCELGRRGFLFLFTAVTGARRDCARSREAVPDTYTVAKSQAVAHY
ncbi:hypothetical protein EMIHUDRAFT_114831 [Emiliania huxleyi CCMP1516]|uniref:WAT1-related protein n=2 Tax=Emiliania huxleyi TaxID=2903 RepID=A0A0D3JTU9_EMIH1|nr:hypothetical protein EMIHUDRAFT_114831 [Emiliania huxleyi CCMP1516]EOD26934.1 hypothetical protein EMIHUDRAFT_114831 [Emiliania huxleyi CCMP1516]|eukprot:XP_005779363.1 hypothetical protein EMIHUDRAFT_114831 [Emiliania huxleyi CCMP1516]